MKISDFTAISALAFLGTHSDIGHIEFIEKTH